MSKQTFDQKAGEVVRKMRREAEISQTALGDALGVSFQQIQKYENGSNAMRLETFLKICSSLGRDPSRALRDLVGGGR